MPSDLPKLTLWTALALSGVAGLVNQVVWQRALKVFLGGSETLSSMVVVLVFMLGLGLGAALASRRAAATAHPLRALGLVEGGLAVLTALIAGFFTLDLTEHVYAAQRLALGLGIPLRAVYAVGSAALLLPPTLLMGATVPLASEALQRQLRSTNPRVVPLLFFVNTLGAAAGAVVGSAFLLPWYGQLTTLLMAVACNGTAAALLLATPVPTAPPAPPAEADPAAVHEAGMGFAFGFLALAYEMLLFRVLVLAHEPLPTTFAVGLAMYLVAWSIGVALAFGKVPLAIPGLLTAAAVAAVPWIYDADLVLGFSLSGGALLYFLPPLGFGVLYGLLVARSAHAWGRDVGRITAANTVGACLGVLAATLVGLEMPLAAATTTTALLLLATLAADLRSLPGRGGAALLALLALAQGGWGLAHPVTEAFGFRTYWGRDGVVEVRDDGNVYIDGLWHTKLTDGDDHIGRPYSWVMATVAVMGLGREPERALVVGAGVGISSVTLEGVEGLQVDGYEINHTLQRVLRDHPEQTLHTLDRERIRWIWQDARVGLALDETVYDVILSAPLHLRQAGSTLLLSTEYLALVKSRLAPDGVLAVYSNEGSDEQKDLIRRTLAQHFAYQVSWYDGVVTLASDQPLRFTRKDVQDRMRRPDRLWQELAGLDRQLRADGWDDGFFSWYDGPVEVPEGDTVIRDDQPLLEHLGTATE